MCLIEELRGGMGTDEHVSFGMIVICPSTGDVIWDEFEGVLALDFPRIPRSKASQTRICGLNLR
jgi:hypothetical protein